VHEEESWIILENSWSICFRRTEESDEKPQSRQLPCVSTVQMETWRLQCHHLSGSSERFLQVVVRFSWQHPTYKPMPRDRISCKNARYNTRIYTVIGTYLLTLRCLFSFARLHRAKRKGRHRKGGGGQCGYWAALLILESRQRDQTPRFGWGLGRSAELSANQQVSFPRRDIQFN
jgi:hypothetical protein